LSLLWTLIWLACGMYTCLLSRFVIDKEPLPLPVYIVFLATGPVSAGMVTIIGLGVLLWKIRF